MCFTEIHVTTFEDPFQSHRLILHTVSGSSMTDVVAKANTRLLHIGATDGLGADSGGGDDGRGAQALLVVVVVVVMTMVAVC